MDFKPSAGFVVKYTSRQVLYPVEPSAFSAELLPLPDPFFSSSLGVLCFSESTCPGARDDEPPGGDSPLPFIAGLPPIRCALFAIVFYFAAPELFRGRG
jgi:hypothetical protein